MPESPQHTPGPWEVVANGEGQWADDESDIHGGHPAYWIKGPRFLQFDWNQYAFTLEDARLIAAAPDLLAACEAFMGALECDESVAALEAISAAIAKARGE